MTETITVTSTDELLAMRDEYGIIRINGGLRVECDIKWPVYNDIAGIMVDGDAEFYGITILGDATFGNAIFRRNTIFHSTTIISGKSFFHSNASFYGSADFDDAIFHGNAIFRGDTEFCDEYLIIMGDMYWSHASMPTLPDRYYIRRILPFPWQRDYYQERLGMDFSTGCYDDICNSIFEEIDYFLSDDKWTPTERWMLETLRDSGKEPPAWVEDMYKAREQI